MKPLALLVATIFLTPALAASATYIVAADGSGDFPTIQAAVYACEDNDVIELASGVFTGDGNRDVDFASRNITIRSQSGNPAGCIIDCQATGPGDAHRGFYIAGGALTAARLEGITVRNGFGPGSASIPGGGAVLITSGAMATVIDCVFEDNACEMSYDNAGGAVYVDYYCEPIFRGCVFRNNRAYFGGAFASNHFCHVTLEDCLFVGNEGVEGGAVFGNNSRKIRCVFYANFAQTGGAVWGNCYNVDYYENCTLAGNRATDQGGGIYAQGDYGDPVRLVDTIIAGCPQGEAIAVQGLVIVNLSCCDLFGNAGGDWIGAIADQIELAGNFSADPCFCDEAAEDFHLCADSWCLAGHHPWGCGRLVGAFGEGCGECECGGPIPIDPASWGKLKAMYR